MDHVRVAFVTIPHHDARRMARSLVEARLAACVNIIPRIQSVFWWEGKVQEEEEALLVVKTTQLKVESLINFVRENHPSQVPEILTFKLSEGLPDYLNYVIDEMGKEVV